MDCYQENFDQAQRYLEKALQLEPNNPDVWYHLALTCLLQQNWSLALRNAEQTLIINSFNSCTYAIRGFCYHKLGDPDKALADLNHAIELEPEHTAHWYYCGIYYRDRGNREQAINDLREAIRLEQDFLYLPKAQQALAELETEQA